MCPKCTNVPWRVHSEVESEQDTLFYFCTIDSVQFSPYEIGRNTNFPPQKENLANSFTYHFLIIQYTLLFIFLGTKDSISFCQRYSDEEQKMVLVQLIYSTHCSKNSHVANYTRTELTLEATNCSIHM